MTHRIFWRRQYALGLFPIEHNPKEEVLIQVVRIDLNQVSLTMNTEYSIQNDWY